MSCQDIVRRPEVDVDLPEAPPETYLRWARWDRTFERTLRRNADRRPGPRLAAWRRDDPAALIGAMLVRDLVDQARSAKRAARRAVAPHLRWHPALLLRAVDYLDRRRRAAERLALSVGGMRPAAWEVLLLQARVIGEVRAGLSAPYPDGLGLHVVRSSPGRQPGIASPSSLPPPSPDEFRLAS